MTFLSHLLSTALAERIGWTLLHSLWQFALLAVLLAGVLEVLRRRSANLRYLVGCFALAAMLAGSVTTFCLLPADSADAGRRAQQPSRLPVESPTASDPASTADAVSFAPLEVARRRWGQRRTPPLRERNANSNRLTRSVRSTLLALAAQQDRRDAGAVAAVDHRLVDHRRDTVVAAKPHGLDRRATAATRRDCAGVSRTGRPRPRAHRAYEDQPAGAGAAIDVGRDSDRRGLAQAGDPPAGESAWRSFARPVGGDSGPRIGAHPAARLPRESAANRGGNPAVLPSGGVVAFAAHPHRAGALLRRRGRPRLRQQPRPGRSAHAAGSLAAGAAAGPGHRGQPFRRHARIASGGSWIRRPSPSVSPRHRPRCVVLAFLGVAMTLAGDASPRPRIARRRHKKPLSPPKKAP